MHPPARKTRSTSNPGVVDLPRVRRSPADVAADKAESKRIAEASAKKKRERAAQVARVENEIRAAQKEAAYPSGRGQNKRVKKTFSHRDLVEEVSLFNFFSIADSPRLPKAERAPAVSQNPSPELKRKAGEALEPSDEEDHTRPTKLAKCVVRPCFLILTKLTTLGY